ncbi:hypothetical protein AKJ51_00060 [candidate division MSBL1 archaeon SCGC-AAA382A20]|uniref:Helicase ATP-binding domain-containing protein n=1 Tax=candidate division MSBL1 archaeon SCGC-AAA382A20 TaxID=1698280 RepID=A0A133VMV8_9EURY|nr:hypothetical protein AKJ51_00060 [candidate division MSBL1 archaeon SCGC-AAA382A20]
MRKFNPDYSSFREYKEQELKPKTVVEQLLTLDDEIANNKVFRNYVIPVPPEDWRKLENFYNEIFGSFLFERLEGIEDIDLSEVSREKFHFFRENIAELNKKLPGQRPSITTVLPEPAERLLLKRLRQKGFDPTDLDISYVERGGGIYLLELFVNAAQQQVISGRKYLNELFKEAKNLSSDDQILEFRRFPVLMVKLWPNQIEGLKKWFEHDCKGILEMATATGKTVAGIGAIAALFGDLPETAEYKFPIKESIDEEVTIMIVAHSNAILKQWEREINEKLGLPVAKRIETGKPESINFSDGRVEFYTAQSLLPRYDRDLAKEYDLVIYDEVHHYSNIEGFGNAIRRPNFKRALGLSATIGKKENPKRERLEEVLAPVRYTFDLQDARKYDIIPDFEWTVHTAELSPYEQKEWKQATDSIRKQFQRIKNSEKTKEFLKKIPVKFNKLEDLGDFLHASRVAEVKSKESVPKTWKDLQATINSRNWVRHRSKPKLNEAVELAEKYLTEIEPATKIVMHAMDIETTEKIADLLEKITNNIYKAHSKLESSSKKTRQAVRRNIDDFSRAEYGVLISPKLLDEGIDVPDAEVGINVAGTKTKLQLVQRMGRILRKSGDKKPHFHHFIALPGKKNYIGGIDSKEYAQQLNWIRELGEYIGEEPKFEEPKIDPDVIDHAKKRGRQLWAQDLLEEMEIETI